MIPLDPRIPSNDSPNFLVRLYELFKEYAKEINNILLTVNGRLLSVDAGSASAPSISFDGDENTGIYSTGADQIGISTGGTNRLTIDAIGNVGIGESLKTGGKLQVNGVIDAPAYSDNLYYSSGWKYKENSSNIAWYFGSNSTSLGLAVANTNAGGDAAAATVVTAFSIASSGTVTLEAGQLKFPSTQNASADANTLDDYEEGTWTPTLTNVAFSGANTSTYNYTKIGNIVHVSITLQAATSVTCTGWWSITLPINAGRLCVPSATHPSSATVSSGYGTYGAGSALTMFTSMSASSGQEIVVEATYHV